MRSTSIDAYEHVKKTGVLGRVQLLVLKALSEKSDSTQNEIARELGMAPNIVTPRFAELHRMGVIETGFPKKCDVTGRRCYSWYVTGELPRKPEKTKSTAQILREQELEIARLRERVQALEEDVLHLSSPDAQLELKI